MEKRGRTKRKRTFLTGQISSREKQIQVVARVKTISTKEQVIQIGKIFKPSEKFTAPPSANANAMIRKWTGGKMRNSVWRDLSKLDD